MKSFKGYLTERPGQKLEEVYDPDFTEKEENWVDHPTIKGAKQLHTASMFGKSSPIAYPSKATAILHAKRVRGPAYVARAKSGLYHILKEDKEITVGQRVHLGHAQKGGAGYIGTVHKIDGDTVHLTLHGPAGPFGQRTVKGPKKHVSSLYEEVDHKAVAKQYKRNETQNRHSENTLLLAKHYGTEDEVSKAQQHLKDNKKAGYNVHYKDNSDLHISLLNRARLAAKKDGFLHEDIEQLDELKKSTLLKYVKKATGDAVHHARRGGFLRGKDTGLMGPLKDDATKHYEKSIKRAVGIGRAASRLAKEGYETAFDESGGEPHKYKVGDKVIAKIGPHKGAVHQVIHVHATGHVNIKPLHAVGRQNRYHLGAASAHPKDIEPYTPPLQESTEKRKKKDAIIHEAVKKVVDKKKKAVEPKQIEVKGPGIDEKFQKDPVVSPLSTTIVRS